MLFSSYQNAAWYKWPTIIFDPLNTNSWGNAIIFRVISTNQQFVTTPSASSLYGKRVNIVFTRISWVCYVYYDWLLVKQFNDNTSIPAANDVWLFSRNLSQQTQPTWAKWDEFILETRWRTQQEAQKYYTYTKWRVGIL